MNIAARTDASSSVARAANFPKYPKILRVDPFP